MNARTMPAESPFAAASLGKADWRATVRLPDFFARAGGALRRLPSGEQATMVNRLLLTTIVLAVTLIQMFFGDRTAQDFFRSGLPWLGVYLVAALCLQIHLLRRPASFYLRRAFSAFIDAAIVSYGLWRGGAGAGYLFPLYFWLILGHGVRFGAGAMGAAVAFSSLGFGAVCSFSPFWRQNSALATGLTLSLVIIPLYGALRLRRAALARAEADRANHAKTLLLASVSHELRTPLTAIVGLGALLRQTPLDDEQREMVQTLEAAGGLLMRHIEALLSVSRDEMERRQKPPERVDLYALLISLRALLAVEAEKKGVRVGVCIDATTPRHIWAEPGLLLDILQNLGGNAVKFTAAGAVAIHVACRPRDAGSVVLRKGARHRHWRGKGRAGPYFRELRPGQSRHFPRVWRQRPRADGGRQRGMSRKLCARRHGRLPDQADRSGSAAGGGGRRGSAGGNAAARGSGRRGRNAGRPA